MRAIKIDVSAKTITEVDIQNYKEIYTLIGNGCELFTCPIEYPNNDVLYTDDEGLLHDTMQGCFWFPDWDYPLVGNAVIWGTDEDGESIDAKTRIEDLIEIIKWGDADAAETQKINALSKPSFIFYPVK